MQPNNQPGGRRRNFFELVGKHFEQHKVPFLIPDLEKDIPFGVHITMAHAKRHDHPAVRQWYHDACSYFDQLQHPIEQWAQHRDIPSYRRLSVRTAIREPRETRTGYTKVGSKGRGVGSKKLQRRLIDFMTDNRDILAACAVEPDNLCCADGFAMDRVSDVMIALGKRRVIEFTKWCAAWFKFDPACLKQVWVENIWQPEFGQFGRELHTLPVDDAGQTILLVPSEIVRSAPPFSAAIVFREVFGPEYKGPTGKRALLEVAKSDPEMLVKFSKDWLRDPKRYQIRRNLRPPKPPGRKRRRK